jgi:hypothetical protein
MRRLSLLLAAIGTATIFAIPGSSQASYPSSCTAIVYGHGGGCTYQASGPGSYRAITAAGWRIYISRSGGPWVEVASAREVGCTGIPPMNTVATGSIPSEAGDLVQLSVAVGCLQYATPAGPVPSSVMRYQVGYMNGGPAAS